MALSFGADCIRYFQYGDASPNYSAEGDWSYGSLVNWDYSKNEYYDTAQSVNKELLDISEILNQYNYAGACTLADKGDNFTQLKNPHDFSNVISDFENTIYDDMYLVGCFEKKDGNGYAFTLVNVEPLDDVEYDKTIGFLTKIKINGETVTFYKDGVPVDVTKDSDGYYNFSTGNGYCWLVTVE